GSWTVAWDDELSCLQDWDHQLAEHRRLAEDATTGVIAPPPEALFSLSPENESRIRRMTRLYLDRVELARLESVGSAEEAEPQTETADRVAPRHRAGVQVSELGELEPKFRLWIRQGFRIAVFASTSSQLERIRFV